MVQHPFSNLCGSDYSVDNLNSDYYTVHMEEQKPIDRYNRNEVWFTSDSHFCHRNIIRYCNRPFANVDEMNEALINNWNSVVKPTDTIFNLGDFTFGGLEETQNIMNRLNGKKHLILGNHDEESWSVTSNIKGWDSVQSYKEIFVGSQRLIMFHYGMRVWNKIRKGTIQLYGHSHGRLPGNSQSLDVGVDCWNYTPVNLTQIYHRLKTLPEIDVNEG